MSNRKSAIRRRPIALKCVNCKYDRNKSSEIYSIRLSPIVALEVRRAAPAAANYKS